MKTRVAPRRFGSRALVHVLTVVVLLVVDGRHASAADHREVAFPWDADAATIAGQSLAITSIVEIQTGLSHSGEDFLSGASVTERRLVPIGAALSGGGISVRSDMISSPQDQQRATAMRSDMMVRLQEQQWRATAMRSDMVARLQEQQWRAAAMRSDMMVRVQQQQWRAATMRSDMMMRLQEQQWRQDQQWRMIAFRSEPMRKPSDHIGQARRELMRAFNTRFLPHVSDAVLSHRYTSTVNPPSVAARPWNLEDKLTAAARRDPLSVLRPSFTNYSERTQRVWLREPGLTVTERSFRFSGLVKVPFGAALQTLKIHSATDDAFRYAGRTLDTFRLGSIDSQRALLREQQQLVTAGEPGHHATSTELARINTRRWLGPGTPVPQPSISLPGGAGWRRGF